MALHFTLRINGAPIGYVAIRRLDAVVVHAARRPNTYEVRWFDETGGGLVRETRVKHTYADGALVLVRKALQALEREAKRELSAP